jgi:hypothetical protein
MFTSKDRLEGKIAILLSQVSGDTHRVAGRRLLEIAAELLEAKEDIPEELQDWIAQGIRALLQGGSTTEAFCLPSQSKNYGNPYKDNLTKQEFEREVGEFISVQPTGNHKSKIEGKTIGAHVAAAKKFRIGESRAGAISKNHAELTEEEWLIKQQLKQENEADQ